MTTSIVIDTNVLSFAAGGHGDMERTLSCKKIIVSIMEDDDLAFALDTDEEILEEYQRNLTDYANPFTQTVQKYFERQLKQRDGISFHIPLDSSDVDELRQNGFHQNDLIFVRIAPRSDAECIGSCDNESLLDEDHKEWIEQELDVEVYHPEDLSSKLNEI